MVPSGNPRGPTSCSHPPHLDGEVPHSAGHTPKEALLGGQPQIQLISVCLHSLQILVIRAVAVHCGREQLNSVLYWEESRQTPGSSQYTRCQRRLTSAAEGLHGMSGTRIIMLVAL